MPKVTTGAVLDPRTLTTITGDSVRLPHESEPVHLQFRRFAGCPVCNLHLQSFVRRHEELTAAGVREIVLFHSPADELRRHAADLPFAVVADPDKRLYTEFGVEASPRAILNPRVWRVIPRAVAHALVSMLRDRRPMPPTNPHGGRYGLPADFLVAPDGRVLAAKYGTHASDQWSVDEVLRLVRPAGTDDPATRR